MSASPSPGSPLTELACHVARLGGETLLAWREKFKTREKGPADLVTDADLAAQQAIRDALQAARPEDLFVGEEDEGPITLPPAGRLCWVVDPLDGTTNYVHGFPCFATSVGAVLDGQVVAGAIYDPLRDELFAAGRGEGATLNGQPIQVSQAERLADALVAVSLPPHVDPKSQDLVDFVRVVDPCQAIRRTGSAALNLAYVAAGRLDAHWAHQVYPWDAAAGTLLIEEAGGVITSSRGGTYDVWQGHYLTAATETLHADLRGQLGV